MSEQLRYKMQTFEATPPPEIWQALAARLSDDQQHAVVAQKLNAFEASPPSSVWLRIVAELDRIFEAPNEKKITEEAPVRSINTSAKWYRMAAAAVITILLTASAWYFINNKLSVTKPEIASIKEQNQPTTKPNSNNPPPLITINTEETNNVSSNKTGIKNKPAIVTTPDVITNDSEKTFINLGKNSFSSTQKQQNSNVPVLSYAKVTTHQPSFTEQPVVITVPVLKDENGKPYRDINTLTANNTYLVVAGPNGQMTRVSSKFANVIRFLNTDDDDVEENLDRILKESGIWKQRFQEWRNKIKQSSFVPTPGNYLDILELKELIKE